MKIRIILCGILFSVYSISFANEKKSSIKLNPLGVTPLSAVLILPKTNTTPITIIVQGKEKEHTIGTVYPANYGTKLPIHGLYENHTNRVVIRQKKSSKTYKIVTAKLNLKNSNQSNEEMSIIARVTKNLLPPDSLFDYDLYFSSLPNVNDMIGFDKKGDIRYLYHNKNEKPTMMRMEADDKNIYMLYVTNHKKYIKIDLLGNIIFNKEYDVHHESVAIGAGREITLGNSHWGWEDMVFELDRKKDVVRILSLGDLIREATSKKDQELLEKLIYDDKNIYSYKRKEKRIDWAHANSLTYDKKNDRLLVSLRHQGVLAIKYKEWKLEWFLADDELKVEDGVSYGQIPEGSLYLKDIPSLQKYRMEAPKNFGPRGQHALFLKKNGNLILFDNRSQGRTNTNGSRVLEYSLNHKAKKAKVVREFVDKDRSYSQYVGDIDLSGQNLENWLIFYGHNYPRRIIEVSPKNEVLFNMDIKMSGMLYRVDKFPLYPYRNKKKKYTIDNNESILPNKKTVQTRKK